MEAGVGSGLAQRQGQGETLATIIRVGHAVSRRFRRESGSLVRSYANYEHFFCHASSFKIAADGVLKLRGLICLVSAQGSNSTREGVGRGRPDLLPPSHLGAKAKTDASSFSPSCASTRASSLTWTSTTKSTKISSEWRDDAH